MDHPGRARQGAVLDARIKTSHLSDTMVLDKCATVNPSLPACGSATDLLASRPARPARRLSGRTPPSATAAGAAGQGGARNGCILLALS